MRERERVKQRGRERIERKSDRERVEKESERERERERGRCGSLEFHANIYDVGCWSKNERQTYPCPKSSAPYNLYSWGQKIILMLNTFSELEVSVSYPCMLYMLPFVLFHKYT